MTAEVGAARHSLSVADLATWVRRSAALIAEHAEELTDLDAAIGDADHGTNMKRGLAAAAEAVQAGSFASADTLLKKVGTTLVSTVGGASGPLYGTFFLRAGGAVAGLEVLDAQALADALEAGVGGLAARGRATTGEKTMLDAWSPALEALRAHPGDLAAGVAAAAPWRTSPVRLSCGPASRSSCCVNVGGLKSSSLIKLPHRQYSHRLLVDITRVSR